MKFWPVTIHAEIHFDSVGCEPNPWWAPFIWCRHPWEKLPADECVRMADGFILRFGALGLHLCFAIHFYGSLHEVQ